MSFFRKKHVETKVVAPSQAPVSPANNIGNLVVNYTSEGILVVDKASKVLLINPAAEKISELSSQELLGTRYAAMVRFEDGNGTAIDPIATAVQPNGKLSRRDLSIVGRKSGKKIRIATTVIPFDTGVILSMRDITQELKEDAEQSEFISIASHEMRTPVASIRMFIELALNPKTATIDERAKEYLTKSLDSSKHLGKLFQDLLDTTKLDEGRLRANLVPLDFGELIAKIADAHAPNAESKGLHYTFGQSDTASLQQVLYVNGDPYFIAEIMNNLIDNAIKYTPKGSVKISVSGNTHEVIATVEDTGIGIAPTDQQHIFQKFYRADNSDTRTIGGTGLGLYVTMKRAEVLGGTIKIKSELGRGSRFSLTLPRISIEDFQKLQLVQQNQWATQKADPAVEAPSQPAIQSSGSVVEQNT